MASQVGKIMRVIGVMVSSSVCVYNKEEIFHKIFSDQAAFAMESPGRIKVTKAQVNEVRAALVCRPHMSTKYAVRILNTPQHTQLHRCRGNI
jgi:uncharacterized protein (DUF2141 family)